jgi:hypothetical protein
MIKSENKVAPFEVLWDEFVESGQEVRFVMERRGYITE